MCDPPQPPPDQPVPTLRSSQEEIPWARPIVLPDAPAHPAGDDILLLGAPIGQAWVDVVALAGALVLFEFLAGTILHGLLDTVSPTSPYPESAHRLFLPALAMRALGALGVVALFVRYRRHSASSIGLGARRCGINLLIGFGALIVSYLLIVPTMILLSTLWSGMMEQMRENGTRIRALVPRLHPIGFLAVAATVGLYEEVLFRGFLMPRLRRATGSWTAAVIISTVVFTALHSADQTAAALIVVAILSLVFSLVTIWRRSLLPAIVAHTLFDFSQLLGMLMESKPWP